MMLMRHLTWTMVGSDDNYLDAHDHVDDVHFAFRRCEVDHADNVLFIGDGNHDCANFFG